MRKTFAKCFVALAVGLAAMAVQGCKKRAAPAPAQPVVRTVPRVQPDFPVGSLPVEKVDTSAAPRVDRARRPQQVQPMAVENPDTQAAAVAAAQKQQDALLLKEQQTASQRQQQELNQEVQQNLKTQQDVQEEPRIQDVPPGALPATPVQPVQPQ